MLRGKELSSIEELATTSDETYVIWIDVRLGQPAQPFKRIGFYFKIWHEIERGSYDGVHQFWWENGNYIVIMNQAEVKNEFKALKKGTKTWQPDEFPERT